MWKNRRGPATAVALAVLVLLVAMAGSATAGALITGRDIKDGTVTSKDLRNGTVTGADVKDGSLSRQDFSGSLQGPQGPAGPEGPVGPQGPQGTPGVSGYQHVVADALVPQNAFRTHDAGCPAGKVVVGGGVSSVDSTYIRVAESAPLTEGRGWTAGVRNTKSTPVTVYVWAVCVFSS